MKYRPLGALIKIAYGFLPSSHPDTDQAGQEIHATIKSFLLFLEMDISGKFIKHPALTLL
jgi:hypothetical protein